MTSSKKNSETAKIASTDKPPPQEQKPPVGIAEWSLQPETANGLRRWILSMPLFYFYMQVLMLGTPAVIGLMLWMQISDANVALLSALAPLGLLAQLFSFALTNHLRRKKTFVIISGCAEVLSRTALVIVPVLVTSDIYIFAVVMMLILFNGLMSGLSAPLTETWVAGLVPDQTRGRTFGKISIIANVMTILTAFGAGYFLDKVPGFNGFLTVFLVCGAMGLLAWLMRVKVPYPPVGNVESANVFRVLKTTFTNKPFAWCIFFTSVWFLISAVYSPFINIFFLKELNLSYSLIAVLSNLQMLIEIGMLPVWGNLIDRIGAKTVIKITLPLLGAVVPSLWIISPVCPLAILVISMVVRGVSNSAMGLGIISLRYQLLPEGPQRPSFAASSAVYMAIAQIIGGLIGSFMSRFLSMQTWRILVVGLNIYQIIFLFGALLAIVPFFIVSRLSDPKSVGIIAAVSRWRKASKVPIMFLS